MSSLHQRSFLLRHGVIGGAALVGLVLLAVFYSVVAGAVDRAATQRRAAVQLEAAARSAEAARYAARPVLATQTQPVPMQRGYPPRSVAYVRSAN